MKKQPKAQTELRHGDYIFTPSSLLSDRFDLYKATINSKTGKDTQKIIGYGYRFEDAVEKMIRVMLSEKEDITDIKGYVSEFKKLVLEVQNLLK